ncbi:hypothetical protein GS597_14100 [Synechococcales cyanobacterium C]|uniref:Uncharacterized protein n=2 Tax=Petrachloros TaxID=2918834 RepID=A0A8K1ZYH0_9CYAN|nr:hypothetical protein [Petrachloros mirabilis ULC683]
MAEAELNEVQWQLADAIARQLVLAETDFNELRKAIAYLRAYADRENAGKHFFDYLQTLARHGRRIGHSQQTQGYFEHIAEVCQQGLSVYQEDVHTMLQVLGWTARLMPYYLAAPPVGEVTLPTVPSARAAEVQAVQAAHEFVEGQTLSAVVIGIKGNKVTYELLGAIKLTEKEPKRFKTLSEGQAVTVVVKALKEDGSLKSVKCAD